MGIAAARRVAPLLGLVLVLGCGPGTPDDQRIARAIASSDSLRHRPLPPGRPLIGREDLPLAATADSDSVAWVNIDQKYPPPRWPYRIDDGIRTNSHPSGR